MSKTIDERVVQMQFDNKQFEAATATSMSTISKLKQSLNFSGATKGLDSIDSSVKKINFSPLSSAVETVQAKFSSLQVVAATALANITNSALNAGKQIVSAFTIDPIKTGFQEYETQINSVQTILANTSHQGTTLQQVNAALDELNTYADKTIYNFTEMTRNIGTFTAAGVDLDTSVSAIKGIANLAAVSGSTSQQASNAMYQLSQALAAGKVSLMDWNSVVNAGMGGKVFQDALMNTAEAMGIVVDRSVSFRESISAAGGNESWLTSDVLLNTLKQFTGDLTDAELAAMGFKDTQIEAIQQMAVTANDAATKVKTFTQLWDTLKESAQSGWTQTWEILIGDFEEAKSLLTELSDLFGGIIGEQADARNTLLYDAMTSNWKKVTDGITEAGLSIDDYTDKVSEVAKKQNIDVDKMVKDYGSLENAFKEGAISSDILNKALIEMTGTSTEISKKMQDLRGEYKTNEDILKALTDAGYEYNEISDLRAKSMAGERIELNDLSDAQLIHIGYTEDQIESIRTLAKQSELAGGSLKEFMDNVSVDTGREMVVDTLRNSLEALIKVCGAVRKAWQNVFPPTTSDQLLGVIESVRDFSESLIPTEETLDKLGRTFEGLFSILSIGKQALSAILSPIGDVLGGFGDLGSGILDVTASFGDWLVALDQSIKAGDSFSIVSDVITTVLDKVQEAIEFAIGGFDNLGEAFSSVGEVISNVFNGIMDVVGRVFNWIRENISAGDIFAGLAGGGIFVLAKKFGGLIDKIKDMFSFESDDSPSKFSEILTSVHDSLDSFAQGLNVASLVGIATAVTLLTSALGKISELKIEDISVSLVTIRLLIASLNSGFRGLTKTLSNFNVKGTLTSAVAMIAIAEAINILADAMITISDLDWGEVTRGLVTVGGLLLELSVAMKIMNGSKISLSTSVAILALSQACVVLADAMKGFSSLSWDEIARGLVAMGGALAELVASLSILSKVGGFGALLGGTAVLVVVQSLDEISENLKKLGNMSWEQIGKGLTAMGVALGEFTVALGVLSKVGGFGAILGGTAILVAVQSLDEISENLKRLGSMSWDEIGRGLTAMGGALGEFVIALGVLSKVGGFGSILGGTAILIAVQSLDEISENLKRLGSMSWDEIGRGLVAMGGALTELGVISGLLGKLSGLSGLVGAGTLLLAVQGLGDLANALQEFGSMSWDEIGRGLVAMGGAMAEVAVVSGLLGWAAPLAGLVGAGTLYLAIQGLGDLADALKKFGSMSWDEIGRGLAAMGAAMGEVALGSFINTLSGLGAGAISKVAQPLGDLADSVKKWEDVNVPEKLGEQLGSLASGIQAFTFGGWGANTIATLATPIGDMADSIKKWEGVSIPSDLGDQIGSLAGGVKEFTFGGLGASSLSKSAPGIGDMADAIKKWSDVKIPDGLEDGLTSIANGVKSFSFAFVGGWSINSIIDPLKNLADSSKEWSDVKIPSTIEDDLTSLAEGVKSFSFAFVGGWSLNAVIEPLENLADSLKNWDGVDVSGLGDELISFSDGLDRLKDSNISSKLADNISDLLDAFSSDKISSTTSNINSLVDGFNRLSGVSSENITKIADSLSNLSSVDVGGLGQSLQNEANKINEATSRIVQTLQSFVSNASSTVTNGSRGLGESMGNNIVSGLNTGLSSIPSTVSKAISSASSSISKSANSFRTAGSNLGQNLARGFESETSSISSGISSVISKCLSSINGNSGSFNKAGRSLMDQFLSGIKSGEQNVSSSFTQIVNSSLSTINGQSKTFYNSGQTLTNQFISGIKNRTTSVTSSFTSIISSSLSSIRSRSSEFSSAASTLMSRFISGITSRQSSVRQQFNRMVSSAASSIRASQSSFYSAGSYLVSGFASGISSGTSRVTSAARSMARSAYNAAMSELKASSPSKLFIEVGSYIPLGFAKGIESKDSNVEHSISHITDKAVDNAIIAISTIMDVFNSDIDAQPTIKPVLDLSNVEAGVKKINSAFSHDQALGISSTFGRDFASSNSQNGVKEPKGTIVNQFTQNNYSPKALSRVEIYRQTNNQFSTFERMTKYD